MGCGGSKLEPEQEAGLRPIIRRRIDEFLARRNAGLSKKELLAGDVTTSHRSEVEEEEEEKEEIIAKEDKTSISPPNNVSDDDHASFLKQDSPQKNSNIDDNSASIILFPILEDKNDVNNIKNDVNNVKNDVINTDVDEIKFENNLHDKEVIKEEECTFDNQDELERSELLAPSSPSFRVYCVHSLDEEELQDVVGQLEPVEECSQEDDKNWLRQESSSSNKVVEEKNTMLKKHKRVKMFKIGIPKGGKHIFHNMHSLYHLPCTSHNSHFIQQAAA
ncbi:pentatricopeptide repeat-containing protein PFL1605w-like isoform X2 [Chenopodium quinoa]|uniref:pentatricopeptide repeat-containing protein PFL1605w-like isoform X2 n=1 Tax=Chenopodium quinoa TaxID=63459 RepID=UPI000B7951BF|nr:pentatricopeptide repeat-containing protein PFL1605w-like isoform X2 [Chenopodium quinoa]